MKPPVIAATTAGSMSVSFASEPAPGAEENEDLVLAHDRIVVVLDGATAASGVDTGCIHNVAWLVRQLGSQIVDVSFSGRPGTLADVLAEAIDRVRLRHADTCDLSNPDSPSSTVALLRHGSQSVEYLVLADSPIIFRSPEGVVTPIQDDRLEHLPGYTAEIVREARNTEGGFWVAGTKVEAAYQAVAGDVAVGSVACAGLFTDGATRLVERHGLTWDELLDLLASPSGARRVIAAVREADAADTSPGRRGKRHDDATAVLCQFPYGRP